MFERHELQLRQASRQMNSLVLVGKNEVCEKVIREFSDFFAKTPDLPLELVFSEFLARQENGEQPDWEEFYKRFPDSRDRLERLFKTHESLGNERTSANAGISAKDPPCRTRDRFSKKAAGIIWFLQELRRRSDSRGNRSGRHGSSLQGAAPNT